jgi:uncharacterized protein
MPEYLAPGVYVEEVDSAPPPIQGVGTSTTAFLGMARRGPIDGRPLLVTNYGEFVRAFGGAFDFGPTFAGYGEMPHAARGFFANGGRRLYVMRVAPTTATEGTHTLTGGLVTHLVRDVPAAATGITLPTVRGVRNGTSVQLRMVKDGITTESAVLTVSAFDRATGVVTLNATPSATVAFESRYTTVFTDIGGLSGTGTVTNLANPTAAKPSTFGLVARNPGSWAHDVRISTGHRSAARTILQHALITAATNAIPVQSTAGFYPGSWIEIDFGNAANQKVYRRVDSVTGTTLVLAGAAVNAGAWDPVAPVTETRVSSCEFDVTVTYQDPVENAVVNESFTGLTLESVPGRHYLTELARSQLLEVDGTVAAPAALHPFLFPSPADGFADALDVAGSDGTAVPTTVDIQGNDAVPGHKTGLASIEDVDEVAILAAPGITTVGVQRAVIDQCERLLDRFAILDPPPGSAGGPATLQQIQDHAANFDTRYAAIYYPRVKVTDALTGAERVVAPSGHMAGIYARVDNTRGVHKAPANEVIRGITDLELFVSKAHQEVLNPRGINVLRDLRSDRRGLRVYGARCLTAEANWIYVNVRRLFIFLEESIDEGTQYAVFEPNDERLWARLRDSVSIFLTGVWRDGALMGSKPEEAYFVVCDRNTMSDDDVLNGRLVMEIGIAPVRPAEFVIIRIGQWLGGSTVQEL